MRWFKHMTASTNDEKLSRLRDEFGLAGYGFWWSVVEIIAGNLSEDEQTSVTFSPKKWGNSLGISAKKFQTLAEFCAKIGLFQIEFSQNAITINMPNILKYKDEYTGKRTKKSGQTPDKCRDNVRPSRARGTETDTETDTEYTPLTPQGGNCGVDETPASEDAPTTTPPAAENRRTKTARPYSAGFENFWAAYPNKVGKDAAWRAWQKRKADLPEGETLLAILARQRASQQWQKEGGQYVPHPATWLNQGRWQDVLETPQTDRWAGAI